MPLLLFWPIGTYPGESHGQLWQPAALRARAPADRTEIDRRKHQDRHSRFSRGWSATTCRAGRQASSENPSSGRTPRPSGSTPRPLSASSSNGTPIRSRLISPHHPPALARCRRATARHRTSPVVIIVKSSCHQAHHHLERIGTSHHWKIGGLEDCQNVVGRQRSDSWIPQKESAIAICISQQSANLPICQSSNAEFT